MKDVYTMLLYGVAEILYRFLLISNFIFKFLYLFNLTNLIPDKLFAHLQMHFHEFLDHAILAHALSLRWLL
jgi:hypothetical protein